MFGLGLLGQRLALSAEIALPPQLAVQSGGNEQGLVNSPVLLSQAQPISGGIIPVENGVSMAGSSAEPQSSTQEVISIARMPPGLGQNRRRPKMAGIPEGLKAAERLPEGYSESQQVASEGIQTTPAETQAGPAATQGTETLANTAEAENAILNVEDDNSPGAIARRKAELEGAGRKYAIAPIYWRGRVFASVSWRRTRYWGNTTVVDSVGNPIRVLTPPDNFAKIKGAQIEASTFILHPWVATVFGGLGVVSQESRFKYLQDNNIHQFFGGAGLNLFPTSRFPFIMLYEVDDSRANTQISEDTSNSDTLSKKLNVLQKYQPRRGPDEYIFGYDYNSSTSQNYSVNPANSFSRLFRTFYAYSSLHGSYSSKLGRNFDQPFLLSGSHDTTTVGEGSAEVRDNIRANHVYRPEEYLLTLHNYAGFFQSRFSGSTTRNFQIGSEGTWQPEELDNPLIVNGGARYFRSQYELGGSSSNSQVFTIKANATYNKWAYLTLQGGGTLTETSTNGTSNLATTQFGRAYYRPGLTNLNYGLRYSKMAEAGFSNLTSSRGSNLSTYVGVSHSLNSASSRHKFITSDFRVSAEARQSLYVRTDRLNGSSQTLTNAGSVTWIPLGLRSRLPGTNTSGKDIKERSGGAANLVSSVGLHVSDTRTWGRFPSHSQSFRLSMGAGAGSAYLASASGYGATADASIEYSRNTAGGESGGLQGNATWGHRFIYNYQYRKRKVFNIKGLNYRLQFNANIDPELRASRQANFQTSKQYATNSNIVAYGVSLNQTLLYRIGQNEALLTASIADSYGINTASLFLRFRAWRNFGN